MSFAARFSASRRIEGIVVPFVLASCDAAPAVVAPLAPPIEPRSELVKPRLVTDRCNAFGARKKVKCLGPVHKAAHMRRGKVIRTAQIWFIWFLY